MRREEGFVGQGLLACTDPLPAHQVASGEMPHSTWASERLPQCQERDPAAYEALHELEWERKGNL